MNPQDKKLAIRTDFIYMLERAVKAPSGHNTQPWLFRVGEGWIQILPDMSRMLPVVDPENRELFISLGCATENLCIAAGAKGYAPEISISEKGEITVLLREAPKGSGADDFIAEIADRQTNRGMYSGERIEPVQLAYLRDTPLEDGTRLRLWTRDENEYGTLAFYIRAGNERQMNDSSFKRELSSWMRFNKRHVSSMPDGLSYAVFGAPNLPRFISETVMLNLLRPSIQNKADKKRLASSACLALFTLEKDDLKSWVLLGRSLQRFLLRATSRRIAYAFMNQPCEVADLSRALARDLSLGNESVELILRLGYASKKMPYSPRKSWREKLVP